MSSTNIHADAGSAVTDISADVLIVGSGFGGCLTGLILDRLGLRVVIVDRAVHPRFAIGESSTPLADLLLRDLAQRYDLPRLLPLTRYGNWRETYPEIACGRKRGFSYFAHARGRKYEPAARNANELLVAASSADEVADTHWFRADVDAFFADEVRDRGIALIEGFTATETSNASGWMLKRRSTACR